MGTGLYHIPAFAQVSVHKKTAQEVSLVGVLGKERVKRITGNLNLLAVEQVEGFLRCKPYPFALGAPNRSGVRMSARPCLSAPRCRRNIAFTSGSIVVEVL